MGVLYAKVSGQWVPIAPAGTVAAPAQAGPRSDLTTDARFGNLSQSGDTGYMAAVGGNNYIVSKSGTSGFVVWDLNGTAFTQVAAFRPDYSLLNGWGIGTHPLASGYAGLWRTADATIAGYVLLARSIETLINVPAGGTIGMRVGNTDKVTVIASKVQTYQAQLSVLKDVVPAGWADAQILSESASGGGYSARICLHQYYAPQIRVGQGWGERVHIVSENGGYFVPIAASAFEVGSALATKHDVRTLHPQRERIVVHHDPFMDEVPDVDVMALRPVVFRRNGGPPNHVEHGKDPVPDPLDSSFGIQATREQLGLIADEVQHVIPSAVSYDVDRQPTGIDYAQITVALLDHVQRLTDEVATLRYRIAELEGAP